MCDEINKSPAAVRAALVQKTKEWLDQHGRYRSNLAGALVILDALKDKCPLSDEDVFTNGEIKRGRGSALRLTLHQYGIRRFLADGTTTRGARGSCANLLQRIEYGKPLVGLGRDERASVVNGLIDLVRAFVDQWLARHPIQVGCDPAKSATTWVEVIMREARSHKSQGRVEQHLVGAKLQKRHPDVAVPVHAVTAGDAQTGRPGDFQVGEFIYHVTVAPTAALIEKCRANLADGLRPIILVPRELVERAKGLASAPGIEERLEIWALEDFVAKNLVEMAADSRVPLLDVLKAVLETYNQRVAEAEIDPALRIDVKK